MTERLRDFTPIPVVSISALLLIFSRKTSRRKTFDVRQKQAKFMLALARGFKCL